MNFKVFLGRWLPVILWCGVIFYLSSMPATSVSPNRLLDNLLHDLAHVLEYGFLLLLLRRATKEDLAKLPKKSFLFLFLFALSDEAHQFLVPTRSARLDDILFDLAGGLIAWKFLQLIQQKRHKN